MSNEMADFFTKAVYGGGCAVCERPFEEEGFARKAGHCEFEGRPRRAMFCRVCWEALQEAPMESGAGAPSPRDNPGCPLCERGFGGPGVVRSVRVTLSNWAARVAVCADCVARVRQRGEAL